MIDRLTEDQRKVLIIWFFLALFLIALLVLIASRKIKAKHDYPLDKNYIVVKDYSRYYTVTSVIDKFYNALNNKNYESAMKMLDDNYVKTNNLSTNNLNPDLLITVAIILGILSRLDANITGITFAELTFTGT